MWDRKKTQIIPIALKTLPIELTGKYIAVLISADMDELNTILEMTKDQSTQKEQDEVSVNFLLDLNFPGFSM